MAKQRGIIKLDGTIGDITFYRGKNGYVAREKGGVSAERIRTDPAYQRTRENGAEFGRAGKSGKVLRNAIRSLLQNASDSKMVSRLSKAMLKAIQMDETNPRGLRNLTDGKPELLQGFEFNEQGKLSTTLYAPQEFILDRVSGAATISFAPFVPTNGIAVPGGTTHFKIVAAGMEIDFENEVSVVSQSATAILPYDTTETAAIELENPLTANSAHPLFLVLGLEFYQEVNGGQYPLKNGSFNPLQIVRVAGV